MEQATNANGAERAEASLDEALQASAPAAVEQTAPRSQTVGFVYPLYAPLITGLEMKFIANAANVINQANHAFLLLTHPERRPDNLQRFVQSGLLDGVILMQIRLHDPRVEVLQRSGVPFVLVGRCADNSGLAYVDADVDAAIAQCLDHLVGLGHRAIVLLHQNDPEFGFAARTLAAFTEGCQRHNLPILTRTCGMSVEAGQSAMEAMLGLHPEISAAIVWMDRAAWGAHEAAQVSGRRVPEDVSIVSIEMSLTAGFTPRSLTYVDIRAEEMASCAAHLLLDLLENHPLAERQMLVAPRFVLGDTTAPPWRIRTPGGF
jgi:DNA-binding LacI/PurR family transcriptional regulator